MADLTGYEKRAENIARNNKLLNSLELHRAAADFKNTIRTEENINDKLTVYRTGIRRSQRLRSTLKSRQSQSENVNANESDAKEECSDSSDSEHKEEKEYNPLTDKIGVSSSEDDLIEGMEHDDAKDFSTRELSNTKGKGRSRSCQSGKKAFIGSRTRKKLRNQEDVHSLPLLGETSLKSSEVTLDEQNEDDIELQQALVLSLQDGSQNECTNITRQESVGPIRDKPEVSGAETVQLNQRRPNTSREKSCRQHKKPLRGQTKLTPSEADSIYFIFDDLGRGCFREADLTRVSETHDFFWSEDEIQDMISVISSSQNGKASLKDFHDFMRKHNYILEDG